MKNLNNYFYFSINLRPRLIIPLLLFCALSPQGMEYYRDLRWGVCLTALYIALESYYFTEKPIYFRVWLSGLFSFIAVLFNPLFPFYLSKNSWKIADIIVGVIFIASTFIIPKEKKTLEIEIDLEAVDHFNLGNTKMQLKDYSGAIEDYNIAVKLSPKYAEAYSKRGFARMMVGNHGGAFEDFEKAIVINPYSADNYSNRGNAIVEHTNFRKSKEDYNDAIENYNKAILINPYSALAYCKRGISKYKCATDKFMIEAAIQDFNRAIAIVPNYAEAYSERGYVKLNTEDKSGALQDFNKAIDIDPFSADSYYRRSIVKGILEGYQESIQDINKAIELNPNFALAYSYRGVCKTKLGDKNGALLDWNKAVKLGYHEANDLIKMYSK